MINSSWGIECDRLTLVIMGFFALYRPPSHPLLSFLKPTKISILKKWTKMLKISSFTHVYQKLQLLRYDSWYTEWDRQNFLSFWAIFCPFTPLTTHKIKILKNEKSTCRSYHFTRMYQKLRSYLWFLRYEARQTVFLSFWVIFCLWPS